MNRIKIFGLIFSLIFFASCLSDDSSTTNTPGATGLTITDFFPATDKSVPINAKLVLTFSEDVTTDKGIIEVWDKDNTTDIADVTLDVENFADLGGAVTGKRVFFPEISGLEVAKTYFMIFPSGVFKSKVGGKLSAGVGVGESTSDATKDHKFYFKTIAADNTDPTITDLKPVKEGSKIYKIQLKFSESVVIGDTTAKIQVFFDASDNTADDITMDTLVKEFDISGDNITSNYNIATSGSQDFFFPLSQDDDLSADSAYFVLIDKAGGFVDVAGKNLARITDETDFTFDTK